MKQDDLPPQKPAIQINVVEWGKGQREVAVFIREFDQMLMLTADGARNMAFLLMECADFITPPFEDAGEPQTDQNAESESIFGPYEENTETEIEDDVEEDERDNE